METIKFKDLSFWLKVGIVGGIGSLSLYLISFILGFLEGYYSG